jgi:hypothetical protein
MQAGGGGKARRGRCEIGALGFVPIEIESGGADETVQIRMVRQWLCFRVAISNAGAQVGRSDAGDAGDGRLREFECTESVEVLGVEFQAGGDGDAGGGGS